MLKTWHFEQKTSAIPIIFIVHEVSAVQQSEIVPGKFKSEAGAEVLCFLKSNPS